MLTSATYEPRGESRSLEKVVCKPHGICEENCTLGSSPGGELRGNVSLRSSLISCFPLAEAYSTESSAVLVSLGSQIPLLPCGISTTDVGVEEVLGIVGTDRERNEKGS